MKSVRSSMRCELNGISMMNGKYLYRLTEIGRGLFRMGGGIGACFFLGLPVSAGTNVYLTDVPDYEWHAGCFGTATGNLMGYWDRHGFPNFYTGPTSYGLAPLNSVGINSGIRSLWASQSGLDGRPQGQPGHVDDYYSAYSSALDPHVTQNRVAHESDCLGDFIGLSQNKWKDMNGECDGNIDAYSFVYWDSSGDRRVNFTPGPEAGLPAIDIQSGLRAWTEYRGHAADVFTQLNSLSPETPFGKGFTFQDMKAEIDAGYPVLMFLQNFYTRSRELPGMDRGNPVIHGILAYGYYITDDGLEYVRYRTSFAGGDNNLSIWKRDTYWSSIAHLRGVIGYRPHPQITSVTHAEGQISIQWAGPASQLYDVDSGATTKLNWYVVEKSTSLTEPDFITVSEPTADNKVTIPIGDERAAFFRLRLLPPEHRE
jgi:hypothetical protein